MGIGKIIIGLILVIVGLWAIIPYSWGGLNAIEPLLYVLWGVIPAFLIFIGAILVWIECEELKIEKPTKKRR
jgi:ABC-type uncharacterized transport system permease subunit